MSPCRKAFTLTEMMVVVLIVGILAAVSLPYYTKYTGTTHFVNAITESKTTEMYAINRMKRTMNCTPPTGAYTDTPKSHYFLERLVYAANSPDSSVCVIKFRFNHDRTTPAAMRGQVLEISLIERQDLFIRSCFTTAPKKYLGGTKCLHIPVIAWDASSPPIR